MSKIYSRTFDKGDLSFSHRKIIELVGKNFSVLELGSSSGYLTKEFFKNGCDVTVIELDKEDYLKALKFADNGYCGSLDNSNFLQLIKGKFDVVVAADIIEHLKEIDQILEFIKSKLKKHGRCIMSLPNIACWRIRKDLFFRGKFEYQEMGVLDKTHLKFFTLFTISETLKDHRLKIRTIHKEDIHYPLMWKIKKIPLIGPQVDKVLTKVLANKYPNLVVGHLILELEI